MANEVMHIRIDLTFILHDVKDMRDCSSSVKGCAPALNKNNIGRSQQGTPRSTMSSITVKSAVPNMNLKDTLNIVEQT